MIVRGDVLKEKPDAVIVDLGFTVLTIPRDEIQTLDAELAAVSGPASLPVSPGALYRVEPGREELSVGENVKRCAEAVVEVRTPTGLGSGFLINPEGYVVTNDHVVAGENKISVTVFEQRTGDLSKVQHERVRIVATYPEADLALLKIESPPDTEFPFLPFADETEIYQGQTVFAIGSPLGFERTVAEGIVSAPRRLIDGNLFVQITAAINPGNSGGPLLDLRGRILGVNNMKISGIGVDGLSFAIPVDRLRHFLLNRDAFAFDPRNPNAGFRYLSPPTAEGDERD